MSSKVPRTFDYNERSKIKEAVEANFHDHEFVSIVRDTIFGRSSEDDGDGEGDVIDFNRMEDETCLRLYNAITNYGIKIHRSRPLEDSGAVHVVTSAAERLERLAEKQRLEKRRQEREKARKAPIKVPKPEPILPSMSSIAHVTQSASKREKVSGSRIVKTPSKFKEIEPSSSIIKEASVPVHVPNRMKPSEKVKMRRVLAHVQGIRRFAAASVLKWERPKSGAQRGSCLVMFDFDRSLQWISVAAAPRTSGRGPLSTVVSDLNDLHAPAVSAIYSKAHSDALLRLPFMPVECGTGDSMSIFNDEGELEGVAVAVTPQQCKTMLQLLKGLDHIITFESRLLEVERALNRGKYENALQFVIGIRKAFEPQASEEVLDCLVVTSVMEGYWTELLKDAIGGGALRGDKIKRPSTIRVKNSKSEWQAHNELCREKAAKDGGKRPHEENGGELKRLKTDFEEEEDESDESEDDNITGNEIVVAKKTGRIVWAQTDVCPGWWPAETCVPDRDGMSLVRPTFTGRFFMVLYFANIEGGEAQTWDPLMASCIAPFSMDDLEEKLLELPNTPTDPEGACFMHMIKRGRDLGLDIPHHYRESDFDSGAPQPRSNNTDITSEEELGSSDINEQDNNEESPVNEDDD